MRGQKALVFSVNSLRLLIFIMFKYVLYICLDKYGMEEEFLFSEIVYFSANTN